jgi:probable HAF family extracellular repeat protein
MFLADSIRARRGAGAAIAAALDFCFPKCEKLSLTSYVADCRPKRAEHATNEIRRGLVWNFLTFDHLKLFRISDFEFRICDFVYTWHALRSSARQSFSNLFFLQSFKFLCIVFTALALTSTTQAGQATRPTAAAAQPIPCTPAAPAPPPQVRPTNTGDAFLLDKKGAFNMFAVPGDVRETVLSDLNNRGQFVGGYVLSDLTAYGFLMEDGVLTLIDAPGALATFPLHINAKGQIVGSYSEVSETAPLVVPLRGFLLSDGVYTTIDVPGASSTLAFGINDRSQIVGGFFDADDQPPHGFLLDDGVFTIIDIADATATVAIGINARGQIVGVYFAAGTPHGFLLDRGVCTTIDPPGSQYTQPNDINDRGQIVGQYEAGGVVHGFLLDKGTFTTIDAPGASRITQAIGINDRGEIVGTRETAAPAVESGSPGGNP